MPDPPSPTSRSQPGPRASRARAARRPLLIALASVAALIAAAWVALVVAFPPARLRALLETQASRALGREVRFERASLSLWPPVRLTVREPAVAEPGGFKAGTMVSARSVHLDFDLFALLVRRLVARRLEVVEPSIHLVLHPDGTTNFDGQIAAPGAPGEAGSGRVGPPPLDLLVREFRLRRARVQIDDQRARRRIVFGLDSRLDFASEAGGTRIGTAGEWRVSGLAFGPASATRVADLNHSLAGLEWRLEHRGRYDATTRRLALDRLALAFGRTELVVAGTVDDPGAHATLALEARGQRLDLAELLGFLSAADLPALKGVRGSGEGRFELGVAGGLGPGRSPELTGTLAVSNATLRYPGVPAPVEALSFNARLGPDVVEVRDLSARFAGRPLRARIEARHFADPTLSFALAGDVDLAVASKLAAPKGTRATGRANLDLSGSGRAKDLGNLALQGRARLEGATLESPALPKQVEGIGGTIEFSLARAALHGLTARAGASSFTLEGSAARPLALLARVGKAEPAELSFRLDSPYLDLAELLPPGPGAPLQLNARGGGEVAIGRLKSQKLDVRNVKARVTIEPGRVEVPAFTFDGYGGVVSGTARFGTDERAQPTFAIRGRADSVRAGSFLAVWVPAAGLLDGSMNTTFDLSGAGSRPDQILPSLSAVGLASVTRGWVGGPALEKVAQRTGIEELRRLRFQDLRLPFRVERGRVVTDPVRLTGRDGEWKLVGAVGFDGRLDYAVSAALPRDVAAKLGTLGALAAAALPDGRGGTVLDFRVTGPWRDPNVALDARTMSARLAGRAGAALEQQSRNLGRALGSMLAPDSVGGAPANGKQAEKDLKQKAGELLEGLFGRKRAPAPPPADSASRDTGGR